MHFDDQGVTAIPETWLQTTPHSLVVGEGVYARALALVLGCGFLLPADLLAGPRRIAGLGVPRVLGQLERVFLIAGSTSSPSDLLRWHDGMWEWVMKLSPAGDQHDLQVVFVMPDEGEGSFTRSLLAGLALKGGEFEGLGYGICRMTDGLTGLLSTIGMIHPMDLAALRSRQRSDTRHMAVTWLRNALAHPDQAMAREAVASLAAIFNGEEYHLDLFCRPPAHSHGNALRQWMAAFVTRTVTPEQWQQERSAVAGWFSLTQNH